MCAAASRPASTMSSAANSVWKHGAAAAVALGVTLLSSSSSSENDNRRLFSVIVVLSLLALLGYWLQQGRLNEKNLQEQIAALQQQTETDLRSLPAVNEKKQHQPDEERQLLEKIGALEAKAEINDEVLKQVASEKDDLLKQIANLETKAKVEREDYVAIMERRLKQMKQEHASELEQLTKQAEMDKLIQNAMDSTTPNDSNSNGTSLLEKELLFERVAVLEAQEAQHHKNKEAMERQLERMKQRHASELQHKQTELEILQKQITEKENTSNRTNGTISLEEERLLEKIATLENKVAQDCMDSKAMGSLLEETKQDHASELQHKETELAEERKKDAEIQNKIKEITAEKERLQEKISTFEQKAAQDRQDYEATMELRMEQLIQDHVLEIQQLKTQNIQVQNKTKEIQSEADRKEKILMDRMKALEEKAEFDCQEYERKLAKMRDEIKVATLSNNKAKQEAETKAKSSSDRERLLLEEIEKLKAKAEKDRKDYVLHMHKVLQDQKVAISELDSKQAKGDAREKELMEKVATLERAASGEIEV